MPTSWASYQSAIQFVAGGNLALFALPNLRAPHIQDEADKWRRLLRAVGLEDPDHGKIRYGRVRFLRVCEDLDAQDGHIRVAALAAAAQAAAVLAWSTFKATYPASGPVAWISVGVGAVPAGLAAAHNLRARRLLAEAKRERQTLERERQR